MSTPGIESHGESLIEAPAKLTLSLRITGVRDDGYHLIDAEMVSLDVCDELRIREITSADIDSGEIALVFEGPFADGIEADGTNLVARALSFVGRSAQVSVTKNIPHGGGLGGGSTDAAAILRWAGRTSPADVTASAKIGADVPFCIRGGRAHVRGIGEELDTLPHVHREFTLIVPPLRVSTPAVYAAWDSLGGPEGDHGNDLEPAAIYVEPRLGQWRDCIASATGVRPKLAGSGATWFLEGRYPALTEALPDAIVRIVTTRPAQDQ